MEGGENHALPQVLEFNSFLNDCCFQVASNSSLAFAQPTNSPSRAAVNAPASPVDESKVPHYFGPSPNYGDPANGEYGQDPTWDQSRWGGEGNLWYEHVYMPAQNPGDPGGMSAYGRWMYGPGSGYPPTANMGQSATRTTS